MSDLLASLAKSYASNKVILDQLAAKIANHKGRGKADLLKQYHEVSGVVSFIGRFITNHMTDGGISGYIGTTSSFTKQKDGCKCCVEVTFGNSLDKEPSVDWKICSRCYNLEVQLEELEADIKSLEVQLEELEADIKSLEGDIEDEEEVEKALREQLRKLAFIEWLENPDYIFDATKRDLIAESGLLST